ncbi:MAG: NRDE family protein [Planctomycetes bacterium]|nr:NRDE family protein [Planctomycetota bacterium]
MCLLAVSFQAAGAWPLVVAANRDEFLARPAAPLQTLRDTDPRILGGRDLLAGGTWLAVNEHGVVAGLTNRPASGRDPAKRSRGELPLLLAAERNAREAVAHFRDSVRCADYNPCWLLAGDREALFYVIVAGNVRPEVRELPPGLHVLENRPIDAPSAKAASARRRLEALAGAGEESLVRGLRALLADHDVPAAAVEDDVPAADDARNDGEPRPASPPQTRAACVHAGPYGTRSSTIVRVPATPRERPAVQFADGPPCQGGWQEGGHLWLPRFAVPGGANESRSRGGEL